MSGLRLIVVGIASFHLSETQATTEELPPQYLLSSNLIL
jgi:hypothetical protein